MTQEQLVDILKQGSEAWNAWRDSNSNESVDLENLVFERLDLSKANLSDVTMTDIRFDHSMFRRASFDRAHLKNVRFRYCGLVQASFNDAQIDDSRFKYTDMTDATFTGARMHGCSIFAGSLFRTNFKGAELGDLALKNLFLQQVSFRSAICRSISFEGTPLEDVDFTCAVLATTSFTNIPRCTGTFHRASMIQNVWSDTDLRGARHLETVAHRGPSTIGIDTLYKSRGDIPDQFLRACGVPDEVLQNLLPTLRSGSPIQFYSCFISYSSKDQSFADRLYPDLQAKGVRCWFAPEDLKIGDKFRVRIDESIRIHDKLLLVLSEHSVSSDWVEKEVETAMERERQEKRTVLFPIRLDDAVMEIPNGWPADIRRTRHIGDFTKWKNQDDYQKAFDRLLRDLKAAA
jgi:uncharacterized protein YjbI with pentapeptide repeats